MTGVDLLLALLSEDRILTFRRGLRVLGEPETFIFSMCGFLSGLFALNIFYSLDKVAVPFALSLVATSSDVTSETFLFILMRYLAVIGPNLSSDTLECFGFCFYYGISSLTLN